jgi:hypothetical protein
MKGGLMVVDTPQTVASKQNRYLRLMRKAQQLHDPLLVRLILQKLALLNKTGSRPATDKRVIIPFPSMQASAETFDYEPLMFESSDINLNKGRGKIDKKLIFFYGLAVIVLVFMFVFLVRFYNPDVFFWPIRVTPYEPIKVNAGIDYGPQYAPELNLFAGACVLLLIGHMFWAVYRKFKKDNQFSRNAMEVILHSISLETGWTEYELFRLSAKGWSVSGARIDEDFKRYMAHQVVPYYVMDFVRKNHENIDESLIKKEEIKPSSLRDLVKALILFPGSILLPLLIPIFFGYNPPW